ncbi:MAG: hypothetical protein KC425_04920 [Anaerolineales bacterium]|nr:hypothetical protein [Anaerolineales bacterium]
MIGAIHAHSMRQFAQYWDPADAWANALYARAGRRRWWERLWDVVRGKDRRLSTPVNPAPGVARAGLRQVPLGRIRGSESAARGRDFDGRFRPRNPRLRARWLSIARAWYAGIELPPVSLVQVGDGYYARDEHHRVWVAGGGGQEVFGANVVGGGGRDARGPREVGHA